MARPLQPHFRSPKRRHRSTCNTNAPPTPNRSRARTRANDRADVLVLEHRRHRSDPLRRSTAGVPPLQLRNVASEQCRVVVDVVDSKARGAQDRPPRIPRPCLRQEHADPEHILGQRRFLRSTRPDHVRPESAVPATPLPPHSESCRYALTGSMPALPMSEISQEAETRADIGGKERTGSRRPTGQTADPEGESVRGGGWDARVGRRTVLFSKLRSSHTDRPAPLSSSPHRSKCS